MGRPWGKLMFGVRLEKQVQDSFFSVWTNLMASGMRPGDRYTLSLGRVAHRAANTLVRELLKSDCDTLAFIDSDADLDSDFFNRMRDFEAGQEYDALQAFYVRRGWPPDAVWFREDGDGRLQSCLVLEETTEEVALIGLHVCLIRREVFEKLLGDREPEKFDWFYYPRDTLDTEDAAFSFDARRAGFRLGATTFVKANHIASVNLGWETYQEYLQTSGIMQGVDVYQTTLPLVAEFSQKPIEEVETLVTYGSKNVSLAWNEYQPSSAVETRAFYGNWDNGYLFDLLNWNSTKTYSVLTRGLYAYSGERALVIGGGLGTEAELLSHRFKWTVIFDLPGILKQFQEWRFRDKPGIAIHPAHRLEHISESEWGSYELICAIDVVEHVHPDEIESFLLAVDRLLAPGGVLYVHANFAQQDIYPMHFDHQQKYRDWIDANGYTREGVLIWRKPLGAL